MTRPEELVGRSDPGVLLFSVQEILIGGQEEGNSQKGTREAAPPPPATAVFPLINRSLWEITCSSGIDQPCALDMKAEKAPS